MHACLSWQIGTIVCWNTATKTTSPAIQRRHPLYIFCITIACITRCDPDTAPTAQDKVLWLNYKGKFEEFFALPLDLEIHDGLRLAIAYRHHGQRMVTGIDPDTFTFDGSKCNIIVESCTSNYAKHNYAEDQYSKIRDVWRDIDLRGSRSISDASDIPQPRFAVMDIEDVDIIDLDAVLGQTDEYSLAAAVEHLKGFGVDLDDSDEEDEFADAEDILRESEDEFEEGGDEVTVAE